MQSCKCADNRENHTLLLNYIISYKYKNQNWNYMGIVTAF